MVQIVYQKVVDFVGTSDKNFTDGKRILIPHLGQRWLEVGEANNWKLPWTSFRSGTENSCYGWLRRWVSRNISDAMLTRITRGHRALELMMMPLKRDYSKLNIYEGFTSDWRCMDVIVNRKGQLLRLWLCAIFELSSRALVGYYIDDHPSAAGIRLALLDAVRQSKWKHDLGVADVLYGLPNTVDPERPPFLHVDNGKDYKAKSVVGEFTVWKYQGEIDEQLINALGECNIGLIEWKVGLASELGLNVKHARPKFPRGKWAENGFKLLADWERNLVGFCGKSKEEKPHYVAAAYRIHQKLKARKSPRSEDLKELPGSWREYYERTGSVFPIEADFRAWFVQDCVAKYLHREMRSDALLDAMGYMSPIQYLRANRDPNTIHTLTETALAGMLMEYRTVTVRNGLFTINWGTGERYTYFQQDGGNALFQLPHRAQIEFRYSPDDLGRGLVFFDGKYLCNVESQPLVSVGANSEDLKKAIKLQRHYSKQLRQEAESYIARRPSLEQVSMQRAMEEEQEAAVEAAAAVGDSRPLSYSTTRPSTITRITRYDRAPKQKPALKLVKSEGLTLEDLAPPEEPVRKTPAVEPEPWKELWED